MKSKERLIEEINAQLNHLGIFLDTLKREELEELWERLEEIIEELGL